MARTRDQLNAWAELLELCEDECEVFRTSAAMRSAVVEVERELKRLHQLEDLCIRLTQMLHRVELTKTIRREIVGLVPEAFTQEVLTDA